MAFRVAAMSAKNSVAELLPSRGLFFVTGQHI
jgi:hypothetical protein